MTDNCAAMTTLLARVADGTALPEDQARLNAHLDACPSCRAELASQRAMRELLQSYPIDGAKLGFDTRVMAAVRSEAEGGSRNWINSLDFRRWTWRLVPVAAALALASVVLTDQRTTASQADDAQNTMSVATANSEALPVSSALWSDSVSESSLLSLMLTANADDTLSTYRKDQ